MIITMTIPLLTMTLITLVHSGVEDFDRENAEDPQQHSEYAMETFQYYKNREETFRVPDYLQVDLLAIKTFDVLNHSITIKTDYFTGFHISQFHLPISRATTRSMKT